MNATVALQNFTNGFCAVTKPFSFNKFTSYFSEENIIKSLNSILNDMLGTMTKMPKVSSFPGVNAIHKTVSIISFSCVSCLVCYKGVKMLFSSSEIDNKEGRTLLERTTYSMVFGTMSIKLIDTMIELGNTLIDVLMKTNNFGSLVPDAKGSGLLVAILLLLLELFIGIKILITFWMRMAELVFSGVISPVIFVLWINKEWAGFLKGWWRRVAILIFTQVAQVLLLTIYGKMINGLMVGGTFNAICLSIAMLFLVDNTPKVLSGLMDNSNTVQSATSTFKRKRSNFGKVKSALAKNVFN